MNVCRTKWRCFWVAAAFVLGSQWAMSQPPDGMALNDKVQNDRVLNDRVPDDMVLLGSGSYAPLFIEADGSKSVDVEGYYLDRFIVTNRQFTEFTEQNPQWQAANIKPIFADAQYLKLWRAPHPANFDDQPVTYVSWFAARAYCKAQGKRLPSFNEWEYAGSASATSPNGSSEPGFSQRLLEWYSKPATLNLPSVEDTPKNYWGVYGMHGVIWELVSNFNSNLVTGESRADSALENQLFCGAGAAGSVDPSDYAAFMRYAMRSSLEGDYTMRTLGFRCAMDIDAIQSEDQP